MDTQMMAYPVTPVQGRLAGPRESSSRPPDGLLRVSIVRNVPVSSRRFPARVLNWC